ncbi:MAG TPA: hypothetical protein VMS93_00705 [Candidatus Saccharimonadales bacterium]|nr:hypothetical protein [Candidatus Saccharimonadales bacterium]
MLGIGLLAAACLAPGARAGPATVRLGLDIRSINGTPLPARVRVVGSDGRVYPPVMTYPMLSYADFFYPVPDSTVAVPLGATHVTVLHGFEWFPFDTTVILDRDTTLQILLTPLASPAADGWYSGDLHVHIAHDPIDYILTTADARREALGENLQVIQLLQDPAQVTGSPDPISDSSCVVYYSFELRNATWGHVEFPALQNAYIPDATLPFASCWPSMYNVRNAISDQPGAMLVLAHPHTTDDYMNRSCWPGSGLGRELPLLAPMGALDALEVVSYSNAGARTGRTGTTCSRAGSP